MNLSHQIAAFSNELNWEDIPLAVQQMAKDLLADWLANAAGGAGTNLAKSLLSVSNSAPQKTDSVLAGSFEKVDPLTAAWVNGAASHGLEFDDSHRAGLYHPGSPVISAAWAAAAIRPASGSKLLSAIIAGYEVSLRVAKAINPSHYGVWHTTGTVGTLGAAVAAAHCLDLSVEQTAWALGLSGTQASGLWEVLPESPEAKALHPAKAAHSGLLAAMLAQHNIAGPTTILEGPRGVFAAMARQAVDQESCVADLGQTWRILEITFKAYPVCGHTMTALEAAIVLHGQFDLSDIKKIEVQATPIAIQIAGNSKPETEYQAKFSLPYCVVQGLLAGCVTQEQFTPAELAGGGVKELLQKVVLVPNQKMGSVDGRRGAKVIVHLKDGKQFSEESKIRKGDPERPLSRSEKKEKFLNLTMEVWGGSTASKVHDLLDGLPEAESIQKWWLSLPRPELRKGQKSATDNEK